MTVWLLIWDRMPWAGRGSRTETSEKGGLLV
jgi:hypothetical protein